jgi:murein DD-endopeptidase MepM/ murein hydrolase activator NlpD
MADGIAVLAAAGGTVMRVRDGVADVSTRVGGREAVEGHEAGNSVVIDHGGGWETQYGHLRRGSLRVAPGDRVVAGQPIAIIGLSGDTEFLHLHFEIRRDGVPIDPYTGASMGIGCVAGGGLPLWTDAAIAVLAYRGDALFDAGFAVERPDAWAARAGAYAAVSITAESPALIFWVDVIGPRAGDRGTISIVRPDDVVLGERSEVVAETKVQGLQYFGRTRPPRGWTPGRYGGRYTLTRAEGGVTHVVLDVRREIVVR